MNFILVVLTSLRQNKLQVNIKPPSDHEHKLNENWTYPDLEDFHSTFWIGLHDSALPSLFVLATIENSADKHYDMLINTN
jgi:hypothetical protein